MSICGVTNRTIAAMLLALLMLAPAGMATAADLNQAKAAGWVGEKVDGYLGLVKPGAPEEIAKMMAAINSKRKAEYENIATRNGVAVTQVARLTAAKVIGSAASGTYVQNAEGQWVKAP
ncbi:MAG: YdbL family protein [Gammaproteobacteria bacterium]|nr:YdbL family protein [Gammaproteobacteria bacterium]